MIDDCSNNWGADLVCNHAVSTSPSPKILAPEKKWMDSFNSLVNKSCHPFHLEHLSASGSEANLWCYLHCSSEFGLNGVLFACGSYISADGSHLQSFSTTEWHDNGKFSIIASPNSNHAPSSVQKKKQIIALPYHIPCEDVDVDSNEFQQYEKDCLKEIHIRLLCARLEGIQVSLISLELILAGSGATLTPRFLSNFGALCKHHNVHIHVDEILTAGRTGQMLLTLQQPNNFKDAVVAVTMGKWTHFGLVLIHHNWTRQNGSKYQNLRPRGYTVEHLLITEALVQHFSYVTSNIGNAELQRTALIKKIGANAKDCWGKGVLVFSSKIRKGPCFGFQCRYLPTLDSNGKFNCTILKASTSNGKNNNSNNHLCKVTMETVGNWLEYSKMADDFGKSLIDRYIINIFLSDNPAVALKGYSNHCIYDKLKSGCKKSRSNNQQNQLSNSTEPKEISFGDISASLQQMIQAGFGFYQLKGRKRSRHFIPHTIVTRGTDELVPPIPDHDHHNAVTSEHNHSEKVIRQTASKDKADVEEVQCKLH
jgi:hypothetical protein